MPELPEVETIVRQLEEVLPGHIFSSVRLRRRDIVHGDPRPLSRLLPGRSIKRVSRRAKRVILDLQPKAQLVFHLGMSGQLLLSDTSEPLQRHTHLRLSFDGYERELRFRDPRRFGGVWMLAGDCRSVGKKLGPLGPEPLELTPARFRRILSRPRQIKALLLDQRAIAGLGNIYVDESLHAVGVHPLVKANELTEPQVGRLLRSIKSVLKQAIRHGGSTRSDYRRADGSFGWFQLHHRVYNREGKPCRRCGAPIERIQAAGRSSHICPCCQRISE